jgi:HAD superfamily hydrolase (TIGR01544 family)
VAEFAQNNYKKYYPIEMDFSLDPEEKEKLMVKWWSSTQNAVVQAKTVTSKSLLETVIKSNICLRDNCEKFINSTFEKGIPLLIFSAGCGDIIDKMLKHKEPICWHEENMLIVGNMMNFDSETDLLTGFAKPTIHSMNKSHALDRMKAKEDAGDQNVPTKFQKLTKMVDNRTNLFVMGDHLRDGNMKVGMPNIKTFIDFGFLNYSAEKNLETYKDTFDIVLNDDQSFDVVNRLFEFVCG